METVAEWARAEMAEARLWDGRCVESTMKAVEKLSDNAGKSWSSALGSNRQAAGDICGDPNTTMAHLLNGHIQQTVARCQEHDLILVDQDTTSLDYSSHKAVQGMGPISHNPDSLGYFLHSAFALSPDGQPLGLLAARTWVRDRATYGQKRLRAQRAFAEKESHKWVDLLKDVEEVLPATQKVLLVQDREADVFDFLAAPRRPTTHLLIRASYPRRVKVPEGALEPKTLSGTLFAIAEKAPQVATMTVLVPRKQGQRRREATLSVHCLQLHLCKPLNRPDLPNTQITATVIRAVEVDAPAGIEPLEWVLITTMTVHTADEACQIVRYYALRWRIERFHFTLKSGCRVERLQMDDYHTLCNALAICCVVAWRLMYLTYHSRMEPAAPSEEVFTEDELTVLNRATGKSVSTIRDAVRAVAILGGFEPYPSAGEPGVKSLWQGLRELALLVRGWRLARAEPGIPGQPAARSNVMHFTTQD